MKRAATSIATGARKPGGNKKLFKNGKTKTREEKRRFFCLGWLFCQGARGTKERGDQEISSNIGFNETRKTFNNQHRTQETLGF